MTDQKSTLLPKLAAAMLEVEKVNKDKTNDFQNYAYASAEAILTLLRKPLLDRGVLMFSDLFDIRERPYTTSNGKESVITIAQVKFTLVDSETGESREMSWAGEGDDPGDKGLGKAYTNAVKTFLRQTFMLPYGDDPEADSSTDERSRQRTGSGQSKSSNFSASEAQLATIKKIRAQKNVSDPVWQVMLNQHGATEPLIKSKASLLIDQLINGPIPEPQTSGIPTTDVPAPEGFEVAA